MAQGTTKGNPIDTDGTLSADSDFLIPSQKAVKTYVGASGGGLSDGDYGDVDVSGSGTVITLDDTAITGKTAVTADGADYVLISDTSDSGNLKKALASDFVGGAVEKLTYTDNTGYTPTFGGVEGVVFSVLIPANTFSKDKLVDFAMVMHKSNGAAGTNAYRIYLSNTPYAQGTTSGLPAVTQRIAVGSTGSIGVASFHVRRMLYIHPTTGIITMTNQGAGATGPVIYTTSGYSDFGEVSSACDTAMIFDTTVNNYVIITCFTSTILWKLPLLSIK